MITSSRGEVIRLYREIWRTTRLFDYPDGRGELWKNVLRRSARQEFELGRYLKDPEEILKRILIGREALHRVQEKVSDTGPLGDLGEERR